MKLVSKMVDQVVLFEAIGSSHLTRSARERKLKRSIEESLRYVIATGKPGYQASLQDLEEVGRRVAAGQNSGFRVTDAEQGGSERLYLLVQFPGR